MQTRIINNSLGQKVEVFCEDQIGDHIEKFGLYEKDKLDVLMKIVAGIEQAVVLDIGANIGNHTLAFATCAARVWSFEPVPETFRVLDNNIRQNHLSNAQAFPLALSDREETTRIYLGKPGNMGMSSIEKKASSGEAVEIRSVIGDDFLHAQGIDRVDFMKIDVEGHEYFVIRGLMETIRQCTPVITLEWNDASAITRFKGSAELQFLESLYDFHGLATNHDRTVWADKSFSWFKRKFNRWFLPSRPVIHTFNPDWRYDNILLLPKQRHWQDKLPASLFG
jgi:FkbM family methyltransferase